MPPTISEAIGADHQRLHQYAEYLKKATDLQSRIEWRNQFTWALARHAISEELTWYPAMEKWLGQEGKRMINLDREQHQAVKEDLYRLQSMSPDDRAFDPLLNRLLEDLDRHIEHEKNEDLPKLEKLLSREESMEMARHFERTKIFTPTRSHPSAPNKPYFENFAAMLATPIDKLMDLMRSFPEQSKL